MGQERLQDPLPDLPGNPQAQRRGYPVQRLPQHLPHQSQDHARLRGEQVNVRPAHLRQGIFRRGGSAGNRIHVVSADDPAALLTDAPDAVHHVVQHFFPSHPAGRRLPAQLFPSEKIRTLVRLPAPIPHKGQKIRGLPHGIRLPGIFLRPAENLRPVGF